MPLTLRPTGLQASAAFAHLADWIVLEDGREIGRLRDGERRLLTSTIPRITGTEPCA